MQHKSFFISKKNLNKYVLPTFLLTQQSTLKDFGLCAYYTIQKSLYNQHDMTH